MGSYCNINVDIDLDTKRSISKRELDELTSDLKANIKSYIENKVSDLGLKYQKLLDGYDLDVNIDVLF